MRMGEALSPGAKKRAKFADFFMLFSGQMLKKSPVFMRVPAIGWMFLNDVFRMFSMGLRRT